MNWMMFPYCWRSLAFIFSLFLLLTAGCKSKEMIAPRPAVMPTYVEVAKRYNANVAKIDQLWARVTVGVTFIDDRGKKRREQAEDSRLLMRLPNHVALMLGKTIGGIGYELGANDTHYWLFDRRDNKTLYLGQHDRFDRDTAQRFPAPVRPNLAPVVMGLRAIPQTPADHETGATVEWDRGSFVLVLPGKTQRLWVDSRTYLAQRIELMDSSGKVIVRSDLSQPMVVAGKHKSTKNSAKNPAMIQSRVVIRPHGDEAEEGGGGGGELRLRLRDVSDGHGRHRINEAVFDLTRVLRLAETVHDLDTTE